MALPSTFMSPRWRRRLSLKATLLGITSQPLSKCHDGGYFSRSGVLTLIDAGIQPGDMVVAERRATYKPGQIVIAMIDSEYTMKYLRKRGVDFFLEPANSNYKPIYPRESFRVEAVVTAVVRKY